MEQKELKSVKEKRKYRSAVRRKKRNKLISIVVILGIIIGTLVTLSLTVFFPINTIKVIGVSRYSSDEIANASGIVNGDNLLLASESRAMDAICRKYPYVSSVKFERKLPFTLNIVVNESKVFAQIKSGKQFVRISNEGKCLEIAEKYQDGSPVITGITLSESIIADPVVFERDNENHDTLAEIKEMLDTFDDNDLSGITVINLSDEQDIRVTYKNKIVLLFGSNSDMTQKIAHAIATIKLREDNDETGTLNLSLIPGKKNEASFIPKELEQDEIAGSQKN